MVYRGHSISDSLHLSHQKDMSYTTLWLHSPAALARRGPAAGPWAVGQFGWASEAATWPAAHTVHREAVPSQVKECQAFVGGPPKEEKTTPSANFLSASESVAQGEAGRALARAAVLRSALWEKLAHGWLLF